LLSGRNEGFWHGQLADLLARMGCQVRGCDRDEVFFTDALLKQEGLVCDLGFSDDLLTDDISLVIYSSAYPCKHQFSKLPPGGNCTLTPTAFIAYLTRRQDSYAVAGHHGKSTTCFGGFPSVA
jgi:UDP-N-acetylmuramate--alanine ligase